MDQLPLFDDGRDATAGTDRSPAAPDARTGPRGGGAGRLLDIGRIYLEPEVVDHPRGREILAAHPGAERIEVPSHWQIPSLHGNEGNVDRWVRIKTETLVLGVKKGMTARRNDRSSHWVATSTANGCAMACAYCYVPRRKGFANPITVFVNIEQILGYLERHAGRQGAKPEADQIDPTDWVYDIGESSDCSVDAAISGNVRDLVDLYARLPNAKASFATKWVNRALLGYDPRGGTRVRFSLMPAAMAALVDIRTAPIPERIAAIDDFVEAGYEVHVNLSPVIVADGWLEAWTELARQLDAGVGPKAKAQLAAEVIFLTHNRGLHEVNLGWHPKAEEVLWRPELQEAKRSETGGENVRYRRGEKGRAVAALLEVLAREVPWLRIRYAF
jgi:spore photoproduct lyase